MNFGSERTELLLKKMQEIPPIELSYETYSSHKKESVHVQKSNNHAYSEGRRRSPEENEVYHIGLLIPKSKKYVAWFTFLGEEDVCILLELNREKQIVNHKIIQVDFDKTKPHLALGTFLYGSMVQNFFIVEDVLMYKSFSLRKLCFGQRFAILSHILSDISNVGNDVSTSLASPTPTSLRNSPVLRSVRTGEFSSNSFFVLPIMFDIHLKSENFGHIIKDKIQQAAYPIHNIQYRSFTKIIPYVNYEIYSYVAHYEHDTSRVFGQRVSSTGCARNPSSFPIIQLNSKFTNQTINKPSHFQKNTQEPYNRERSTFVVSADVQSDIYNLIHIDGKYHTDVAYIPNYKISVFMNSLFRTIKENVNLDAMEESDDEDDFNDIRFEKYVNLEKRISMECIYHKKFRRWIPVKKLDENSPVLTERMDGRVS